MDSSTGAEAQSVPSNRAVAVVAALTVWAASLAGCGSTPPSPSITVLAAASLRPTFTQIGERFRAAHPGVTLRFDFAGSPDLATQLIQGAHGDVFASADTAQMDTVEHAGLLAGAPARFASNTLVIVTAPGNPHHITAFADLATPGLRVVVSPPPMPCGVATRHIEQGTGVRLDPVSEEPDVEDVLNKITTGEADAGLVNRTDAVTAGDRVATVSFPEAATATSTYRIAALTDSASAADFVDLVTGDTGQQILRTAGFGIP